MAEGRRLDGQPTCGVWPKASLLCGTQVTRVKIDGPERARHGRRQKNKMWKSTKGLDVNITEEQNVEDD